MTNEKYKSKTGKDRFRPVMDEAEFRDLARDYPGFCIGCGAETDGVEPDARQYDCEICEQKLVYGLEELLLMGILRYSADELPRYQDFGRNR